jgi:hypothetical protein
MWKNFKRLILILIMFIVLDIVIGRMLGWGYRNVKSGDIADVNYGVFKCDEEVLFMGASEISRSVVSNLVSD